MVTKTFSNFAQGEISLDVQGRVDLDGAKEIYSSSLAYMRNYIATAQGPFKRRTGTRFLKGVKGFGRGRNIPFVFNDEQAYGLLFSDKALRFTKNNKIITESAKNVTSVTQAAQAVVTIAAHGYDDGDEVYIDTLVGMTELNGAFYLVSDKTADTFKIKDLDGIYIDSSAFNAYDSGGTAERVYEKATPYSATEIFEIDYTQNADVMYIVHQGHKPRKLTRTSDAEWGLDEFTITSDPFTSGKYPRTVHMDGGRLIYGGTVDDPDKYFISKAPKDNGTLQYDNFSVGDPVVASDAVFGYLPTVKGKVDTIKWISSTKKFLTIGTFATVYKVTGPTEADPIAADDVINVKSISDYGCYSTKPGFLGETMFFLQRNALRLRSLNYSLLQDDYGTEDRNLIANRILNGGASFIAAQSGDTDILWTGRNDGIIVGLSFKGPSDVIEGWHRQDTQGEIIDAMSLPRSDGFDTVYITVKRYINGVEKHYIEYFTDEVLFYDKEDFFRLDNSEWPIKYDNYKWEANKDAVFVDSAVTYDGSEQSADLTYLDNGNGTVTVTASESVFKAEDAGREIWPKFDTAGEGGGRITIETVNSATEVICSARQRYLMPDYSITSEAGDWYLTASSVRRLDHLEGEEVQIVTDGAYHKTATVENGAVELDSGTQASKIHVGLKYVSIGKTNNLNMMDLAGNGHTKVKNVEKVHFDVLDSGVFKAGTDVSRLEDVLIGKPRVLGRTALPETNIREVQFADESDRNKYIYVVQDLPYPLIIRGMQVYATANE